MSAWTIRPSRLTAALTGTANMNAQHTPGPWTVSGKQVKSIDHGKRYTVATANNSKFTDEANANNARLIAAAPELLAALEDLLSATEETYDNRHERQAARDAIAQATGAA